MHHVMYAMGIQEGRGQLESLASGSKVLAVLNTSFG